MLNKVLNVHRLAPFSRNVPSKPAASASASSSAQPQRTSATLKIVHAGGFVEYYYMATPALKIMEKYPSFVLARPEVFRRPWDSVVRPDEMLTLGEKFFLVPRRTVRKLWGRIKRPDRNRNREVLSADSCVSKSSSIDVSVNVVSCKKNDFSCKSFCQHSEVSESTEVSGSLRKKTTTKKHVRFVGIEVVKHKAKAAAPNDTEEKNSLRKSLNSQSHEQKRRLRNTFPTWEPSLDAINERNDE